MGYSNFYSGLAMLWGSLNRGVTQRAATVSLPPTGIGMELAQVLRNIGAIDGFSIVPAKGRGSGAAAAAALGKAAPRTQQQQQQQQRQSKRPVPPRLRMVLRWQQRGLLPPDVAQTLPVAAGAITSVQLLAKPTAHRTDSARQLLSRRRHSPPGIIFYSTSAGVMTDIEAELRGLGGVPLAHVGLPAAHVAALRGALRQKRAAELAAPPPPGQLPGAHIPLSGWDVSAKLAEVARERVRNPAAHVGAAAVVDALALQDQGAEAYNEAFAAKAAELGRMAAAWSINREAEKGAARRGDGGGV